MGDRTSVQLTILKKQSEQAKILFTYPPDEEDTSWGSGEIEQSFFTFFEVNYGELGFLGLLHEAGIAYDSSWDAGGEYGPGTISARYTPEGDLILKRISDEQINPDLGTLMALIDAPSGLRNFILTHKELITVLPWDDQIKYGKLYLTRKLIGAI